MAKETKTEYKVIGGMAGSSMDGLDLAEVRFTKGEKWEFHLVRYETLDYDNDIYAILQKAPATSGAELEEVDLAFGKWIAERVLEFSKGSGYDLLGIHGHTVSHAPEKGISHQLGKGKVIAEHTQVTTVTDFRTRDIQYGGQGAPLVPVGDFELFPEYDACLNLGGIANVSIRDQRKAWDIAPCNQVLDFFSKKLGHAFDRDGEMARNGSIDHEWISRIAELDFFSLKPPKSLANGYIPETLLADIPPVDGLRSYMAFLSDRIRQDLSPYLAKGATVLSTGGGALNTFLVKQLKAEGFQFVVPDEAIVQFKEAIVFAFLGLLRVQNEINVFSSVTGANQDSCSGVVHDPK